MKKNIWGMIFISLLSLKCSEVSETYEQAQSEKFDPALEINIDLDKDLKTSVPLEDLLDSITFVQLAIDSEIPIGEIKKVYITEDRIIVVDNRKAQTVFIYNKSGQLIKSRSASGKGPGEFTEIRDVAYDPYNKTIDLYDRGQKKIIVYNLNGELLKEVNIPYYFMYFEVTAKNQYTIYGDDDEEYLGDEIRHYILITNKSGEISNKYLPYIHEGRILSFFKPFTAQGNSTGGSTFTFSLSNNIYYSTGQKFYPAYKVNYGKYTLPLEKYPYSSKETSDILSSDFMFGMMNFSETKTHFFYQAARNRKPINVIYNKKNTERVSFIKVASPYEEFSFDPVVGVTDNALINFKYPNQLLKLPSNPKDTSRLSKDIKKLHDWAKESSDMDNPLLIFSYLKK